MKQIIQSLKNGSTTLENVPAPMIQPGHLLIRTSYSLVSIGTEKMLVAFGKANWIEKVRSQPNKVKAIIDKAKTDGLKPTINAVRNKLDQAIPLGYSNAGVVIGIGQGVKGFHIGDRVASNGPHAAIVSVPQNLVVRIPDNVTDEEAAFTVVGAIGLEGIRLVAPSFGETIVVIGLGLIGQITAQLLKANGCNVIGVDPDQSKTAIASAKGIHTVHPNEAVSFVQNFTGHVGADGVIITASSRQNDIISQSAKMSRKRGRIVLTGVVGLSLNRDDFYEKELSFQVSCSYGPGRYDPAYEQKGQDYPIGYVRWTEQRNFAAVLNAIQNGQLDVRPLITSRTPLSSFADIYDNLSQSNNIAALLVYETDQPVANTVTLKQGSFAAGKGVVGIIGAGNFTKATVLPALQLCRTDIKKIASANGLTATLLAKKYGIAQATTNYAEILSDDSIDTVFITTRHHLHAPMAIEALKAGKNVFVEKPQALRHDELDNLSDAFKAANKMLAVGFNRRFAPLAQKMKSLLGNTGMPMNITITVNAGEVPADSWIHDPETGGGRIIGEACHFIDLCTFLSGSMVKQVCMNAMGQNPDQSTDNATILLQYENGTNATVHYFSNGNKAYDKERVEVYSGGKTLVLENWKKLTGYGFANFSSATSSQDKGHNQQFKSFMENVRKGGSPLIPFAELLNTSRAAIAAIESMQQMRWVKIVNG